MLRFILLGIVFVLVLKATCLGQASDSVNIQPNKSYYLVLYKPGRLNRIPFYVGQAITFKLLHDKKYYSGKITDIRKDSFVFWETEISLSRVDKIKLENHTLVHKAARAGSTLLRKGGTLFTIVGAVNFLVLPQNRRDGLLTTGLGLSANAVGRAGKLLRKRSYKINKYRVLKTRESY